MTGAASPLIVVNPRASRIGDAARRDQLVADISAAARTRTGATPEVVLADTVEEARQYLAGAADVRRPLVVAAGGDGSVREAARDLAHTGIPIGIVPLGTANLFAASVGVPLDVAKALAAIAIGPTRSVDLGHASWSRDNADSPSGEGGFAVAAGIGFDARLMEATRAGHKRRFGRYAYFWTALRAAGDIHGFDAQIEIDGEELRVQAVTILVANAGQLIPGVLRPALPIRVSDGLLDVFILSAGGLAGSIVGGLELVARTSVGPSRSGRSIRRRGSRVRIRTEPAQPVEVDGDVVGSGTLEATVIPAALRVIVAG